jgi:hypothetical protein
VGTIPYTRFQAIIAVFAVFKYRFRKVLHIQKRRFPPISECFALFLKRFSMFQKRGFSVFKTVGKRKTTIKNG